MTVLVIVVWHRINGTSELKDGKVAFVAHPEKSTNPDVVRNVTEPFAPTGGLRLLQVIWVARLLRRLPYLKTLGLFVPAKVFDS